MTKEIKITKAMVLATIKDVFEDIVLEDTEVTPADVIAYVDTTLAQMEKKNAKARENAAKKKADGDALKTAVFAALTSEPQTRDEITAVVVENEEFADVTVNKVGARLTALVNEGLVEKEDKRIDKRVVKVYALAAEPAEDAE